MASLHEFSIKVVGELVKSGNFSAALDLFEQEIQPTSETLHIKATILGLLNHLFEAQLVLEKALALDSNNPLIMTDLADSMLKQGHISAAKLLLERAIQIDPACGDAYFELGLIEFNAESFQEALPFFDLAIVNLSRNSFPHTLKARTLMGLQEFSLAQESFNRALNINPNDLEAHFFLADLYETMGERMNGLPHLEHILKINPAHILALQMLSADYFELNRFSDALHLLKKLLALDTKNSECRVRIAGCLFELGKYEMAAAAFDSIEKLNPKDIVAICLKGMCHVFLKAYSDAMTAFKRASALDPNNFMPFQYMGIMFMQMTRYAEAVKAFSKAIALSPDQPELYSSLGTSLAETQNFSEAIKAHEKACSLSSDMNYLFMLANTLRKSGDIQGAKAAYQVCIQENSQFKEALTALNTL